MLIIDANTCPQNHRCPLVNICPVGAIEQLGYGLPVIDTDVCIECGKCESFCPLGAV
nr:4Fe-4S binding protein [Paludibacteraceae bacterium]